MMKKDYFKRKLLFWPQVPFNVRINDREVITFVAIGKLHSDFFLLLFLQNLGYFCTNILCLAVLGMNYLVLLLLSLVYL